MNAAEKNVLTDIAADCFRQYMPFNDAWFVVASFAALLNAKHYATPSWEITTAVYRPQGFWK